MSHAVKNEDDLKQAARRARLYSIPVYEASFNETESAATSFPSTSEQLPRQDVRPILRLRIRASGPKRLKLRGPRAIPRINCRYRIPKSESKMYVHRANRYECPKGIEPWCSDQKWMLDPGKGIFKKFSSRVELEDNTHYYMPEEVVTESPEPEASQ